MALEQHRDLTARERQFLAWVSESDRHGSYAAARCGFGRKMINRLIAWEYLWAKRKMYGLYSFRLTPKGQAAITTPEVAKAILEGKAHA